MIYAVWYSKRLGLIILLLNDGGLSDWNVGIS